MSRFSVIAAGAAAVFAMGNPIGGASITITDPYGGADRPRQTTYSRHKPSGSSPVAGGGDHERARRRLQIACGNITPANGLVS